MLAKQTGKSVIILVAAPQEEILFFLWNLIP